MERFHGVPARKERAHIAHTVREAFAHMNARVPQIDNSMCRCIQGPSYYELESNLYECVLFTSCSLLLKDYVFYICFWSYIYGKRCSTFSN